LRLLHSSYAPISQQNTTGETHTSMMINFRGSFFCFILVVTTSLLTQTTAAGTLLSTLVQGRKFDAAPLKTASQAKTTLVSTPLGLGEKHDAAADDATSNTRTNDDSDKCIFEQKKSLNPVSTNRFISKDGKPVYMLPYTAAKCGCHNTFCPPYVALGAGELVQARINGGNFSVFWDTSRTTCCYPVPFYRS